MSEGNHAVVAEYAREWEAGDAAALAALFKVQQLTNRKLKLSECWLYDEDQRAVDEFWSG